MRRARTTDVFGMVDLLVMQQARSRYAGAVDVDPVYARRLLAQAIQRNAGTTDGATLVNVIEDADGGIAAFIVGVLNRVYHIGTMLCAQDMFLVASDSAPALASRRLLSSYLQWAQANPAVHEINLSHTDALPEGDRMGAVYAKMGFTLCGGIYRRDNIASTERTAA